MFFGLQVKANQNQAKPILLEEPLKLGQAVLEPTKNDKKGPVSLIVEHKNQQFILCVLDPSISWQSPLDIMFAAGSEIKFFIRGSGKVHLTGYRLEDDMDGLEMSCSSDEEDYTDAEATDKAASTSKKRAKLVKTNGVNNTPDKKSKAKGTTINEIDMGDDTSSDDSNYPDIEDDFFTDDDGEDENDDDEQDDDDDDDDEDDDDDDEEEDDGDDESQENGEDDESDDFAYDDDDAMSDD